MPPWNDWYHCTSHTYGSWLRGDSRGWRARHHREHVDGDYKNPPPRGEYDVLFAYSKSLMKRDPVRINWELRQFVLDKVVERLHQWKIEIKVASLDGNHLHVLIRCPEHNPRTLVGIAKQYATAQLKAHGLAVGSNLKLGEGLWAKRSRAEPIQSGSHFIRATDYIYDHSKKGAVVWVEPPTDPLGGLDLNGLIL